MFLVFFYSHFLSIQQFFSLLEHNFSNDDQKFQITLMIPKSFPNLNSESFFRTYSEPGTRLDFCLYISLNSFNNHVSEEQIY